MRFHRVQTVRRLPHPGRGFAQGLVLDGDLVWESTGQYGESSLRRYRLGAEQLDWSAPLPQELFGEGICLAGDRLWQLTWQERVALSWSPAALGAVSPGSAGTASAAPVPSVPVPYTPAPYTTVRYNREGWGICNAGRWAVTSDGSSELILRDLRTLEPLWTVLVRCEGRRVDGLNDLEWQAPGMGQRRVHVVPGQRGPGQRRGAGRGGCPGAGRAGACQARSPVGAERHRRAARLRRLPAHREELELDPPGAPGSRPQGQAAGETTRPVMSA